MGDAGVSLTIDQLAVIAVSKAMRAEADGKQLRKDLTAKLRAAVQPAVQQVAGKLRAVPHNSAVKISPPLGSALAAKVKPQIRLSGMDAGVKIRVLKTPALRGFTHAARYLNRGRWRHRVYGKDVWVTQESPIPGYFDNTMRDGKRAYRKAVVEALDEMSRRIARKVP